MVPCDVTMFIIVYMYEQVVLSLCLGVFQVDRCPLQADHCAGCGQGHGLPAHTPPADHPPRPQQPQHPA